MLTDDQKRAILEQRATQFESEQFHHELNKATAVALGNDELVTQADDALNILAVAIAVNADELAKLA